MIDWLEIYRFINQYIDILDKKRFIKFNIYFI